LPCRGYREPEVYLSPCLEEREVLEDCPRIWRSRVG